MFKLLVCFLCLGFLAQAQQTHEYLGALKLNDTSFISYRLSFDEKDGLIQGYSVTDFGGPHESKSLIAGYFDDAENSINFYESGLVYTKSPYSENDFCYLHFEGKLKSFNERQQIEGPFNTLYDNGDPCIKGEIMLSNMGKILKKATKLDRKIDRSVLISKEKKEKINLVNSLDSLSMNVIRKNEVMHMFSNQSEAIITVYDAGREDGDRIKITVNGAIFVADYTATLKKKTFQIPLTSEETRVKVLALNNGVIGGNTVKVDIKNNDHTIETVTSLKAGDFAEFVFLRKE